MVEKSDWFRQQKADDLGVEGVPSWFGGNWLKRRGRNCLLPRFDESWQRVLKHTKNVCLFWEELQSIWKRNFSLCMVPQFDKQKKLGKKIKEKKKFQEKKQQEEQVKNVPCDVGVCRGVV